MKQFHRAVLILFLTTLADGAGPRNWPQGTDVPDWWPNQVGLYPGTTIEDIDHAEDRGLPDIDTLVPVDGASVEAITQWYRSLLTEAGWEVWKTRDTGTALRFTSQNKNLDKRIIVQVIGPKQSIFNKSEHPRVRITVYRSIP